MDELLAPRGLAAADADVLHRLVGDWQLLADLSFADLVLYVPEPQGRFTVVAQMRPTTGPTSYQEDLVGTVVTATERPQLSAALTEGRIVREGDPVWLDGVPVREEVLPVTSNGRVIAVIARDTNLAAARTPSRLEIAYLNSANDLAQMLAEGRWPYPGEAARNEGSGPRVGDGLIRLDPDGIVTFASPNALSAYRRLGHPGDLAGARLSQVTGGLADRRHAPLDEPVAVLARGRVPRSGDVEAADAIIALRALPLWPGGEHIGALVLVRDVTELRRHERQLLSKDATIREIHHRVKNNLQTVAALLRLQARRMDVPQARIALEESVRRVSSIAVVHETLSGSLEENVPFDEVADRVLAMIADVGGSTVRVRRRGSFGVLSAELATPLAMVLTELVQNAVEHGYDAQQAGSVEVRVERGEADRLRVQVVDDGRGLPAGFALADSARLGLQIVRTLVGTELGGSLEVESATPGGTVVTVTLSG
jgi:two-component system, sensor histidine kinase PdtaS